MKRNNLFTVLIGGILASVTSISVFGQTSPIEGRWALDGSSAVRFAGADTISVAIGTITEKPYFFLFDTIEFKAGIFSSPNLSCTCSGDYLWDNNKIEISFTAVPYSLEYTVAGEKLYVKQQYSFWGQDFSYQIVSIYKKLEDENQTTK
jgi:hypothetical protein